MANSGSDSGFWGIILIGIIIWLIFAATGAEIEGITKSKEASQIYVENYPWPHSEEDAITRCLYSIESRNWSNYEACFEPSSIITKSPPGIAGKFDYIFYEIIETDGQVSIARVEGVWYPSSIGTDENPGQYFNEYITVIKARKGFLDDININIDLAIGGWFVAYSEIEKLPFDFNSKFFLTPTITPDDVKTPSNTKTPTTTPTLLPSLTPTP